jgi:hypothetical protein
MSWIVLQPLIPSMATLALNSELWTRRLLIGGSPFQGRCPATEVKNGNCPEKTVHIKPRCSPLLETHRRGLLLIKQHHPDVGQPRGNIHSHMGLLISSPRGAAFTTITGDALTYPLRLGQLYGVDVDLVAGLRRLGPTDWLSGLQVSQATKSYDYEPTPYSGEGCYQLISDAPHRATLMAQSSGLLQLLRIELPPVWEGECCSDPPALAPPKR